MWHGPCEAPRPNVFSDIQQLRLGVLALAMAIVAGIALFGAIRMAIAKLRARPLRVAERGIYFAALMALGIGLGCFIYAFFEADMLSETHVELRTKKLGPGQKLRIIQLSDLHVDAPRKVYADLPERVNALKPDVVIFTGDSLNKAEGLEVFRTTMASMKPRVGRYAVRGNHDIWYWRDENLFGGGVATELTGEAVDAEAVTLCGAEFGRGANVADCLKATPDDRYRIVVLHSPDLIEQMSGLGADLYLAGHTHGGQVRAPLYGALVTMSRFDKKYEMGEYKVGPTTLFVSRGVGVEPNAPRIRFLCRPEIAVIDLIGE